MLYYLLGVICFIALVIAHKRGHARGFAEADSSWREIERRRVSGEDSTAMSDYVYCPSGHIAHYIHNGSFTGKWFQAICDECGWESAKVGSEQELDTLMKAISYEGTGKNHD